MDTLASLSKSQTLILTDITGQARACTDFNCHERITMVVDRIVGLNAIIAIHDRTLGPAIVGCQMWTYAQEADATTDVLRLSRVMTYKCAMAGVALGGGKSVIIGDAKSDKSEALFPAFGRAAEETRSILGSGDLVGDPSPYSAQGVHVGLKAASRHRLGCDSLQGVAVAVQGLGSVGWKLWEALAAEEKKLVVTDIDLKTLSEVFARADIERTSTNVIAARIATERIDRVARRSA